MRGPKLFIYFYFKALGQGDLNFYGGNNRIILCYVLLTYMLTTAKSLMQIR